MAVNYMGYIEITAPGSLRFLSELWIIAELSIEWQVRGLT